MHPRSRPLHRCVAALGLVTLLAGVAQAGQASINGVSIGRIELSVEGLEGQRFEKCSVVRIESGGHLRIECPGYDLRPEGRQGRSRNDGPAETRRTGRTADPAAAAPADPPPGPAAAAARPAAPRLAQRYWFIAHPSEPGTFPYDVELYVNGRFVRRFRSEESTTELELTSKLVPGVNKLLLAPSRNQRSLRPGQSFAFVVRSGETASASPDALVDYAVASDDETGDPQLFEIQAR